MEVGASSRVGLTARAAPTMAATAKAVWKKRMVTVVSSEGIRKVLKVVYKPGGLVGRSDSFCRQRERGEGKKRLRASWRYIKQRASRAGGR